MKIQPVRRMAPPRYPDAYSPEAHRALLTYRPQSWRAPGMIAGGLISATLTLALVGCAPQTQPGDATTMGIVAYPITSNAKKPKPTATWDAFTMGDIAYPYDRIADEPIPVFAHGKGTGAVGCVSVVAPMFLSEDEALAIIRAELASAGIETRGGGTREDAVVPQHSYANPGEGDSLDTAPGALPYDESIAVDDAATVIDIKFVSYDDHVRRHPEEGIALSVDAYDLKAEAEALAADNRYLAAFYDPAETVDMHYDADADEDAAEADLAARKDAAKALAERELAAQVREFIDWLRAMGAL